MTDEHPYRTPDSNVVAKQLPAAFTNSTLSVARLKSGVVLSIVYAVLTIPVVVMSFMHEVDSDNLRYAIANDVLSVLSMGLWVYLILLFKSFVNLRFEFHGADRYVHVTIVLSALMLIFSHLVGPFSKATMELNIANYVLLVLYGIFTALFGWRLRSLPYYRGIALFTWINIVTGVLVASVVLMLLAIPVSVMYGIALAVVFSAAAAELSLLGN